MKLTDLNYDVLENIFQRLDIKTLACCRATCQYLKTVVEEMKYLQKVTINHEYRTLYNFISNLTEKQVKNFIETYRVQKLTLWDYKFDPEYINYLKNKVKDIDFESSEQVIRVYARDPRYLEYLHGSSGSHLN